jgi:hypothetical protein
MPLVCEPVAGENRATVMRAERKRAAEKSAALAALADEVFKDANALHDVFSSNVGYLSLLV